MCRCANVQICKFEVAARGEINTKAQRHKETQSDVQICKCADMQMGEAFLFVEMQYFESAGHKIQRFNKSTNQHLLIAEVLLSTVNYQL
jgi:hypothetical protein